MRKTGKGLALLLALLLVLASLAGCGANDNAKFVGVWNTSLEFAPLFNQMFAGDEDMPELDEYIKVDSFPIGMVFTFNEDGTYSIKGDEAVITESMKSLRDTVTNGLRKCLEDMIKEQGVNISLDELFAQQGTTLDDMTKDILNENEISNVASAMEGSGKYNAADGKLYQSESTDADPDADDGYMLYEFKEDGTIQLDLPADGDVDEDERALFPIVLKKAE